MPNVPQLGWLDRIVSVQWNDLEILFLWGGTGFPNTGILTASGDLTLSLTVLTGFSDINIPVIIPKSRFTKDANNKSKVNWGFSGNLLTTAIEAHLGLKYDLSAYPPIIKTSREIAVETSDNFAPGAPPSIPPGHSNNLLTIDWTAQTLTWEFPES